jgi:hypothetical protein
MRGIYPDSDGYNVGTAVFNRKVRLGTYGDPAAVPAYVWDELLHGTSGWTGYTHQWANGKADHVKQWCMASVDTPKESFDAWANGWRTFRVRTADTWLAGREFICPASEEANKRLTCSTCMACSGGIDSGKASVTIIVHGSLKKRFALTVGQ